MNNCRTQLFSLNSRGKALFPSLLLLLSLGSTTLAADEPYDKAIYGADDRIDVMAIPSTETKVWGQMVQATAALIPRENLVYNSRSKTYTLKKDKTLESYGVCKSERFSQQPMVANCTGFLVEKDAIMTAGHCVPDEEACKKARWVFDYKMNSESEVNNLYTKKQVYQCLKVEKRNLDVGSHNDYALVRLYRKVVDRTPVEVDLKRPDVGTQLVIIGHPSGLPSKIAGSAKVSRVNEYSFDADLDSFAGNSGSPVFNATTRKVLGILVAGSQDYVFDPGSNCHKANICTDETCRQQENVSYISNAFK